MSGPLQWLDGHAAPRVLIAPEALPYRPNRGVFVFVEEPNADADVDEFDAWVRRWHENERRRVGRGARCRRLLVVRDRAPAAQTRAGARATGASP